MSEPTALDQALAELRRDDPEHRKTAVRKLRLLGGPEAVQALLGALEDLDELVQRHAVFALQAMKAPEALALFLDKAKSAPTGGERALAIILMSDFEDPRVLPAMLAALNDDDPQVITVACMRLSNDAVDGIEPLRRLLHHPDPRVRRQAATKLIDMGVAADDLDLVLDQLDAQLVDTLERLALESYRRKLADLRGESHDTLDRNTRSRALAELASDDPGTRRMGLRRTGWVPGPERNTALLRALDDPAPGMRALAVGQIRNSPAAIDALPRLIEISRTDPAYHVRRFCARALSAIDDDRARDAVVSMLKDPDESVVMSALVELLPLRYASAAPVLFRLLERSEWKIRHTACMALLALEVVDERLVAAIERIAGEPEAEKWNFQLDEMELDCPAIEDGGESEAGDSPPNPPSRPHEMLAVALRLLEDARSPWDLPPTPPQADTEPH